MTKLYPSDLERSLHALTEVVGEPLYAKPAGAHRQSAHTLFGSGGAFRPISSQSFNCWGNVYVRHWNELHAISFTPKRDLEMAAHPSPALSDRSAEDLAIGITLLSRVYNDGCDN